jgi:squalene-associated FAD-dependent desaturase
MAKCFIVGGGLAGLSSAVFLSKAGYEVELIESTPKLGGRTYSFINKNSNSEIDNGQHILMGTYQNTFEFLEIIGSAKIPEYQNNLEVKFQNKNGIEFSLKAPHSVYPLNLIQALISYKVISLAERLKIIKFIFTIMLNKGNDLNQKNLNQYLAEKKQTAASINSLWELIAVSAMNTKLNEASAEAFVKLLSKMFLNGNRASTIVLPKVPLSRLFIEPAKKYIELRSAECSVSETLKSITTSQNEIIKITTNKREIKDFDYVILAIPHHAYKHIKSNTKILDDFTITMPTSPIITIHIWLNKELFEYKFMGLIDSQIHWIFRNKDNYSIVISASDQYTELNNSEIFNLLVLEISKYFPTFSINDVLDYKIINEKKATIKCTIENEKIRRNINSPYNNLLFAGDWTNTDLPGTIEGAILSGKNAANIILAKNL